MGVVYSIAAKVLKIPLFCLDVAKLAKVTRGLVQLGEDTPRHCLLGWRRTLSVLKHCLGRAKPASLPPNIPSEILNTLLLLCLDVAKLAKVTRGARAVRLGEGTPQHYLLGCQRKKIEPAP